jgi:long-chain acyl-CoA synthetase
VRVRQFSLPPLLEPLSSGGLADSVYDVAARYPGLPQLSRRDPADPEQWHTVTARTFRDEVMALAKGLLANGIGFGDRVALMARTRYEWTQFSYALWSIGAQLVPVYPTSSAEQVRWILTHSQVTAVVVEFEENAMTVGAACGDLPGLRHIWQLDDGCVARITAQGRRVPDEAVHRLRWTVEPGSVAVIGYTSGTTGRSKGVLLSHANMIATSESFAGVEAVARGDNWLCYLPMGWVGDAMFSLSTSLVAAATCNCPESPETVQRDLRELGPSALLAPPRIWENMLTTLQVKATDASPLKRRVYEYFRGLAERRELLKGDGKPIPGPMQLGYRLGEYLVYGPVRDQLGLRNAAWCLTGGAPLGADTFRFFRSFGINLKQIYGATEASALVCLQRNDEADPNTVGSSLPGTQVRIGESGEVQVKGPGVFVGYYKQEDATRDAMTPDGWLKTGDAGLVDPRGHLAIIDRAKDVGKLADGTPFAPQFVENKLKFSPFIREAVAFGDQRPFVAAMIAIDMSTVGKWAEQKSLAYTSFMDLARKPEVARLITDEVAKINATLPGTTKVARFVLLNKELDADDAEMTRTRKVRRAFVAEKYAPVITALYDGAKEAQLTMDITFEDGRKSQLTSTLLIHDIAPPAPGRLAA